MTDEPHGFKEGDLVWVEDGDGNHHPGVFVGEVGAQARPPLAESLLQRMWGAPVPRLLDRVVTTGTTDPVGLAPATVLAVQPIDAGSAPAYLLNMPRWSLLGNEAPAGVLGSAPPKDSTGYGAACLLVNCEHR